MIRKITVALFLTVILNTAFAQPKWELTKEKDGIKVFTAQETSSKFKEIKVEAVVAGTIQKLESILVNVSNTKNWVYATKESYLIKKISANELLYYSRTALPWPVSDRDIPIKMQLNEDLKNNTLKVYAAGVTNAVPEKKGAVRMPYFNAVWDVKSDGKNKLTIIYILKMDPGGSVPAGVTNLFITKGPYETFSNLAKLLR